MSQPAAEIAPAPPAWLLTPQARSAAAAGEVEDERGPLRFQHAMARGSDESDAFAWLEVVAPAEATAEAEGLRVTAERVYRFLLGDRTGLVPIRFWNFVPGITEPAGAEGLHRYMAFNAGRAAAMAAAGVEGRRIAASAVGFPPGHPEPRLTVQVLLGRLRAEPIENPRQVPAWSYSARFGRTPPTFARSAVVSPEEPAHPGALLLAGTASVVGEESTHPGDVAAQAAETCTNLATLLGLGRGSPLRAGAAASEEDGLLRELRHLRVYVVRSEDSALVGELFARRCTRLESLTLMHAPLCRPELLLEAEGVSFNHLRKRA